MLVVDTKVDGSTCGVASATGVVLLQRVHDVRLHLDLDLTDFRNFASLDQPSPQAFVTNTIGDG